MPNVHYCEDGESKLIVQSRFKKEMRKAMPIMKKYFAMDNDIVGDDKYPELHNIIRVFSVSIDELKLLLDKAFRYDTYTLYLWRPLYCSFGFTSWHDPHVEDRAMVECLRELAGFEQR